VRAGVKRCHLSFRLAGTMRFGEGKWGSARARQEDTTSFTLCGRDILYTSALE
jgi:hypothetical protein